jgi:hypothetical protein
MSFPIKPHDILSLVEDSTAALVAAPTSVRRAYVCVVMAAHLAEHVAAAKGYDAAEYRDQVERTEPALRLVRDLGNYAKHVHITRYSPEAEPLASFDLGNSHRSLADIMDETDEEGWREDFSTEGFYVRDSSSQVHSLLAVMRAVVYFWREELLRLDLWA